MTYLLQEKSAQVQRIYEELDGKIAEFQKQSGLACESGCGRCCENPAIFATVLEVLPLARFLWQNKHAQVVLKKLEETGAENLCVFYRPDPVIPGRGRCGIYPSRPLLCRLFGFAAKSDKHGTPLLVTCPTIKSRCAKEYQDTLKCLAGQALKPPMMTEYALRIYNIDPYLGRQQMPINRAVKTALEKFSLALLK